ncbi:MAG: sulfatase [Gemmatimonadetes bacterium]|nr:sulfatase [Gemmatimonadota bacterium]
MGLGAAAALAFFATTGEAAAQGARPPNVVIINVDDLGWADLSAQGSTYHETPHLDGLAAQGVRFTNAYAAAAVCSPSRAALLTGRYPARVGVTDWIRARFQGGEIPADRQNPTVYVGGSDQPLLAPRNPLWMEHGEVTIAEILRAAGYATAHIGKWHLGPPDWFPETQGFDVNIGGSDYGQPPSYFDPYFKIGQGDLETLRPRREGEYLTDREGDEAVGFIRAHRDRPFFLHLAHYAVHTPLQAKEDLKARYAAKPRTSQTNPTYAAMVHSMDQAVGSVLAAIDEAGLREHTLVIFTSDNGGLEGPTSNSPLRSGKGYPYEGGIRVPLIVRWPGAVPAARVSHEPVAGIDLFPTVVEAAGVGLPAGHIIDGISLLEHLRSGGEGRLERESLFWHFPHYRGGDIPPYSIIRYREWKLIRWHEGPRYELYNLAEDLGERRDLAAEMPYRVTQLDALLNAWFHQAGAKLPRPNPGFRPQPTRGRTR